MAHQPIQPTDLDLEQIRLNFAAEVRKARKEARLSQTALGKLIGRSQRYVSDVEAGDYSLTIDAMTTIMRALDQRVRIEIKISPLRRP
jgi:predicted transcriptional regulator